MTYKFNQDICVVDSHIHFWDTNKLIYPWLNKHPFLNKPFGLDQFNKECVEVKVQSLVAIQADVIKGQEIKEANYINQLAQHNRLIGASVAWAPLELGKQSFDYIDKIARLPIVRGIRRNLQYDPIPDLCLQPAFIDGVRYLSHHDLSFDICVDQSRMKNVIMFVEKCPETRMVLNHLGKPQPSKKGFFEWCSLITEIASFQNVSCKLSGLLMQIADGVSEHKRPEPYLMKVLEVFGAKRLMYGSDWPVSSSVHTYVHWFKQLLNTFSNISQNDMQLIFCENAKGFYRIRTSTTNERID